MQDNNLKCKLYSYVLFQERVKIPQIMHDTRPCCKALYINKYLAQNETYICIICYTCYCDEICEHTSNV